MTQPRFVLVALAVTFCLVNPATAEEPLMINQIVIHPKHPTLLFAAARPEGVLKSIDRGEHWVPARTGLKNTSAYHLVIPTGDPSTIYLATFGGGVYKSTDEGASWYEINHGLGNTNIHALAVDPTNAERLAVSTSTGELFDSSDGGRHWAPFGQGVSPLEGEVIASLLFDRDTPPHLYLGQGGFYRRNGGWQSGAWTPIGEGLKTEVITTLAFDSAGRTLYAGTMRNGLFLSSDHGQTWRPGAPSLRKKWVHRIVPGSAGSGQVYISLLGEGFLSSADRGMTWNKLDHGLPTDDDILSLAIDPIDPKRLYAGTHNKGIFLSSDGGASWSAASIAQEPVEAIIKSLVPATPTLPTPMVPKSNEVAPPIPTAFQKCTKCHGWTDSALSQKATFWRVPPNQRDWKTTVKRMGPGAGLTPAEEEEIIHFLNRYSKTRAVIK